MFDFPENILLLVKTRGQFLSLCFSPDIDHYHITSFPREIGQNRVFREIYRLGLVLVVLFRIIVTQPLTLDLNRQHAALQRRVQLLLLLVQQRLLVRLR